MNLGAVDYALKPIILEDLIAELVEALGKKGTPTTRRSEVPG